MLILHERCDRIRGAAAAVVILFAVLAATDAMAQSVGDWRVFLNANGVHDLAVRGEEIWAATSGGAIRLSPDGRFTQWTRTPDGLASDSVSVVAVDEGGLVWFGTERAGISVYDPETGVWRPYSSILEPIPGDRIQALTFSGGAEAESMLVGAAKGYAVFVAGDLRDVCLEGVDLCDLPSFDVRDVEPAGDSLWLATASGPVARYPARNGLEPGWRIHAQGLGSALLRIERADSVYGADASGSVWVRRGTAWHSADAGLPDGFRCLDLLGEGPTLWACGSGGVFRRDGGAWSAVGDSGTWTASGAQQPVTSLARTAQGRLYAGCDDPTETRDGIWEYNGSSWVQHRLAGPSRRAHYRALAFDSRGALWSSTGQSGVAPLVQRLQDGRWDVYYGGLGGRLNSWSFSIRDIDGDVWVAHCCCPISTEEFCETEVVEDGDGTFVRWPLTNIWDLDADGEGRLFAATFHDNVEAAHGIFVIDPGDSSWVQVSQATEPRLRSDKIRAVDVNGGDVWIGYSETGVSRWRLGADRLPRTVDDSWTHFTQADTQNPLIGDAITDIAVAPDGRIWIGTTAGLSIYDGVTMRNVGSGFGRLPTPAVNAVLPTADGGAWVSTSEGGLTRMTVRDLGGYNYQVITPPVLPNPNVTSMVFGPDGRTLWLGTSRGLISFVPRAEASDIQGEVGVYPNPFHPDCVDGVRVTGGGGWVRGVITDLSGSVVARFPASGQESQEPGTIVWDGRTEGEPVAPGLYWMRVQTPTGIHSVGIAVMDGECR